MGSWDSFWDKYYRRFIVAAKDYFQKMSHSYFIVIAKDSFQTKGNQEFIISVWNILINNSFWYEIISNKNIAFFSHSKTRIFGSPFLNTMDQPEDHLWILRGTDADLECLLLVLSLGPQYVWTVLRGQGPGWDVKKFGAEKKNAGLESIYGWCAIFFSEQVVSLGF